MNRRRFLGTSIAIAATTATTLVATGCDSSWITTAEQDIDPAVSIVESIAAVVLAASGNGEIIPVALPIATASVAAAKAALVTLKAALDAYQASKSPSQLGKIDDAVTAALASFAELMHTMTGLVPTNILSIITTGVGIITSVLSSLQLVIPASPAALKAKPYRSTAPSMLLTKKAAPPSPAQMLYGYNAVVVLNGFAAQQAK